MGPLTAAIPNTTNPTAMLQAAAQEWMAVWNIKDMFLWSQFRKKINLCICLGRNTIHPQPPAPRV